MATRYQANQLLTTNDSEPSLKDIIEKRNIKFITHYETSKLKYPTVEQIQRFTIINHIWKFNDRYWKLSSTYYGDPKYWWVIAWYNKKPIEASLQLGDKLYIPTPLSEVLEAIT